MQICVPSSTGAIRSSLWELHCICHKEMDESQVLFSNVSFIFPKYLMFRLGDPVYINLHMQWDTCRCFLGHSQLILRGTVVSPFYMENAPNQPNKLLSPSLKNFTSCLVWPTCKVWPWFSSLRFWTVRPFPQNRTPHLPQNDPLPPPYVFCFILSFLVIQASSLNLLPVCFSLISKILFVEWFLLKILPLFSYLPNLSYYCMPRLLQSLN